MRLVAVAVLYWLAAFVVLLGVRVGFEMAGDADSGRFFAGLVLGLAMGNAARVQDWLLTPPAPEEPSRG